MNSVRQTYANQTVLITGHTGFKGSWLGSWCNQLGANVIGVSHNIPSDPSHFDAISLADVITDYRYDIRDEKLVREVILSEQPDYIFHLAAQPLVQDSYREPIETYQTNILGTVNVLEALREVNKPCTAVLITSDKCYENREWEWGYRENDRLGGFDPYSASKAAAELVIRSYIHSFFQTQKHNVRIGVARAGNVIGGGDWSADRIVPDCVRSWSENKPVVLRKPDSTRPWQHVLEPLSGYLTLGIALSSDRTLHGEAFNFGPDTQENYSVLDLVRAMSKYWKEVRWDNSSKSVNFQHESGMLKLNCDKALHHLEWRATLKFNQAVQFTAEWYKEYYASSNLNIRKTTREQISNYMEISRDKGLPWAG